VVEEAGVPGILNRNSKLCMLTYYHMKIHISI
jgi:hypothetical protein